MNKTININLGGIFFHIDETAYQKLKRYLDAIRKSLSDDPKGRDEIISDIELRIGELLSEKVKDARQVVSESDIDEVITIMGQPEDYLVDEELFNEQDRKSYTKSNYGSTSKKLFRDGEDKFLGGVASGIAYYFDVDVIWIRIAFLVSVFAGFGFGILLYIVLWILLPEAKTTADKLQMEGEPVNISNIEKRVRAEFESASESIKDAATEVSEAVKEGYENVTNSLKKKRIGSGSKARSGIQDLIDVLGKIIVTFFMIIGKFIGVILIFSAAVSLIAVLVSVFTAGAVDFMGIEAMFDEDIQVINPTGVPTWIISLLILVLAGIPLLMLFFLGLFIISSRTKTISRTGKLVLLGIWLLALLGAIYIGLRTGSHFAKEESFTENNELVIQPNDTLSVKMKFNPNIPENSYFHSDFAFKKFIDDDDREKFYSNNVDLYVKLADEDDSSLRIRKRAFGSTRLKAKENAEKIVYHSNQESDKLLLDGQLVIDEGLGYRASGVRVDLFLQEGQYLKLDKNTSRYLRFAKNTNGMKSYKLSGHILKMTEDGLTCLDCEEEKKEKEEKNTEENEWQVEETKEIKEGETEAQQEENKTETDSVATNQTI